MKEQIGLNETPSDLVDNLERFNPSDILEARTANGFGRPHVSTVYAMKKSRNMHDFNREKKRFTSVRISLSFRFRSLSFISRSSFFLYM